MNLTFLTQRLADMGIREDFYSLSGGREDDTFCIVQTQNGWEVYYSERGERSNLKFFTEEEEACDYFFRLITSDNVVMRELETRNK